MKFDFYGLILEIRSEVSDLDIEKMCLDFLYFSSKSEKSVAVEILVVENNSIFPQGFYFARTRMCEVRQLGFHRRQMFYTHLGRPVAAVVDNSVDSRRNIQLQVANLAYVEEILFFILNSVVGEYFDSIGLMRIHAAALSLDGKNYIFTGPSKAGKSTLAVRLAKNPKALLFSDELALFDLHRRELLPFPIRCALERKGGGAAGLSFFTEKELLPIADHQIASRGVLDHVIDLRPSQKTSLRLSSAGERLKQSWNLFWGLGVIQMWEYFLRLDNLPKLARVAVNRLRLIAYFWSRPIEVFERSGPHEENLKTLESLLSKR